MRGTFVCTRSCFDESVVMAYSFVLIPVLVDSAIDSFLEVFCK